MTDAVERAAQGVSAAMSALGFVMPPESARPVARAALAAAGAGAEVDTDTDDPLPPEGIVREEPSWDDWAEAMVALLPGDYDGDPRDVIEATMRRLAAGAEVDRGRLVRLIEDVTERAQRDGLHVASEVADALAVLAARGDAATPTVTAEQAAERLRGFEPSEYAGMEPLMTAWRERAARAALGIEVEGGVATPTVTAEQVGTPQHHPVGAYLPIGQLDGDCSCGRGEWPCPETPR